MQRFRDENTSVSWQQRNPPPLPPAIRPVVKLENTKNTSKCQPAVTILSLRATGIHMGILT
jgi:hypothetical protein